MILGAFQLALKNVRRQKLRSWLTVAGIVISITIIFLLISVSVGLNASVKQQFQKLGTDKFMIIPKGSASGVGGVTSFNQKDLDTIERVSGVKDISYLATGSVKVTVGDQVRYVNLIGASLDHQQVFLESGFIEPQEGRILRKGDSGAVMIGSDYGTKDFIGKAIRPGNKLNINGVNFQVKGILKEIGDKPDDEGIYMSLDDFYKLFPKQKDTFTEILVQTSPGENLTDVSDRVNKELMRERNVKEDTKSFSIETPQQLLGTFNSILDLLTTFLLGIAGISVLVGGVGVANTMYTSVLEKTSEIGVMKSIGAKNSDILSIFAIEAGLIGLTGGIIGVILGTIFAELTTFIASSVLGSNLLQTALPWYLYLGCLVFSFAVGAISGIVPAWQASRIKPVDALRYE